MKNKFEELYKKYITRAGADRLLAWLETTDFFTAPASTRYHCAYEGGLVEHSINVFRRLYVLSLGDRSLMGVPGIEESVAIVGLLHDVCKANFYSVEMRNRKNEAGRWEQYPFYIVDDQLPYGHREKSVYIISRFMELTPQEAMAIRWHMGGFDESVKGGSYALSGAFTKYRLALLAHLADMQATYIDEVEKAEGATT